ncbi:MAG: tripartite tricarboxylate transporter substrate binding protein, partial [Spirochaetales bacterium]|nr:tripartite tricarboxylate transporter substrate binding protein [Spirochaetales bacterium]
GAAASAPVSSGGSAGDYPNKPLQLIVPVGAGGDTDVNARIFAKYLTAELGQNVVVNNITGGSGATGMRNVLDAPADGYTALFFHTEALLPKLAGMIDYDLFNFKMCGINLMDNTTVLATHKDSGFKTIGEFINKTKAAPGKLQFGMATGGYPHLVGISLAEVAGIDINIVDIGGNAAKTTALLGHKVETINTQYGLTQDYFESGEFICMGLLSENRNPMLPEIPTLKELGYNLVFNKAFFVGMPPTTSDAVRDVFAAAMEKTCRNPEYIAEMQKYYIEVEYLAPDAATAYWKNVSSLFDTYGAKLRASIK